MYVNVVIHGWLDMFWFGMIFVIDESINDLKHVEDLVQLDTTTKISQFQVHVP